MQVAEYNLFPTTLLSLAFPNSEKLNGDLDRLFSTHPDLRNDDATRTSDNANLLRLEAEEPCIGQLRIMFLSGLKRWLQAKRIDGDFNVSMLMFFNASRKGNYTLAHNHECQVAGIYYAKTAEPRRGVESIQIAARDSADYWTQENGVLILHDPRFNANLVGLDDNDYVKVHPRPGQMLIFPGYLWHSVTPHQEEIRRLAISVNFTLRRDGESASREMPLSVSPS